ncbi:protein of unknown function DUF1538 [Gottschalkia purinilytica]|uniref:DUF1538 domain-containing protein n=1 Tax=Gottschalkia purinilytica TaxID=1503 RepID=A0A0L0WAZ3_GOTPU|nr:DUF1538 domain-containing protein [Gottschalkia purinilytica]KNF08627.1 protein of unknown function DUF1538 [Gottschalkia purinilytica]
MNLKEVFLEVIYAILPITIIVLLLQMTMLKFPKDTLIQFIAGSIMVMGGLFLFLIGVKVGLLKVGELIGSSLMENGKLWLILLCSFVIGLVITVAEPNVQVLANQVDNISEGTISKNLLIAVVALGVGIFIIISLIRIIFNVPLAYLFATCYGILFILASFTSPEFVPISFDSGGVTTGPLTVPFFISLGVGITSVTQSKKSSNDSFGIVGLAFIGPILSMLILGVIFK